MERKRRLREFNPCDKSKRISLSRLDDMDTTPGCVGQLLGQNRGGLSLRDPDRVHMTVDSLVYRW